MSTALAPLWAISEELTALLDSVDTCPVELEAELQERIALFMGQEAAKTDDIAHVIAALEYAQKNRKDEIERLREEIRLAERNQAKLESYVCRVMQARGVKKLQGHTSTLSVRPSDGVVITDEAAVPDRFKLTTMVISCEAYERIWPILPAYDAVPISKGVAIEKAAIKKALKAGEEVSGADLEFRANLVRR